MIDFHITSTYVEQLHRIQTLEREMYFIVKKHIGPSKHAKESRKLSWIDLVEPQDPKMGELQSKHK